MPEPSLPVSPISPSASRWFGWLVLLAVVVLVGRAWTPIVWGTIAAVVLWPARQHLWTLPWACRLPHVLPLLMAIAVVAGLVVPLLWASWTLFDDVATTVWAWAQGGAWPDWWTNLWRHLPRGEPWLSWRTVIQKTLVDHVAHANQSASVWWGLLGVGANALHWLGDAVWFTATLAWWLYDGTRGAQWLRRQGGKVLGTMVVDAAEQALATVRGQGVAWVVLGLIEALVMGATMHAMALPHAWIWGGIAGAMAPIPILSPLTVIGVAIWAWAHGLREAALAILIVGGVVFWVFDAWARPWLASQHSNLSIGWSLAAVVIGLQSVGPLGVFIGPALVSFAFAWINAHDGVPTVRQPPFGVAVAARWKRWTPWGRATMSPGVSPSSSISEAPVILVVTEPSVPSEEHVKKTGE